MIIKATSHTIKNIWKLFLFIILSLILFITILIYGVELNNISLPQIKIDRLYIKLDKKLILEAKNIKFYRDSKAKTSKDEIYKILSYIKYLNPLFNTITLKNLEYNDEKINLLFKENIFYLDSKYLTLDSTINYENKKIKLDIKQLILKDENLELNGSLIINIKKGEYQFKGNFSILNINGFLYAKVKKDILYYRIKSDKIDSLAPIMEYLKSKVFIEPLARDWIYKNIVAKEYILKYLDGKFNLKTYEFYPNLMEGQAIAKDAIISFNPKVKPAHADKIVINLKDDILNFNLTNPTYENKKINIVDIHIYNLLTTKNGIVVDIKSDTLLDKYIHNILHSFDINIPITQYNGQNSSRLKLNISFKPFSIDAKGDFIIKNSNFKLDKIDMYSKYAKIRLDNDIVYLSDANLVYKKLFDIDTTGKFNLKKRLYSGRTDINSLKIELKNSEILKISNLKKQKTKLFFGKKESKINILDLKTDMIFSSQNSIFKLKDLKLFKKYSPLLSEYNINSGYLYISTKDFKEYEAKLNLKKLNLPLLNKDGSKIESLDLNILANSDFLKIMTQDKKLQIEYDKQITINLSNVDLVIKDNNKTSKLSNFQINGDNVNLKFIDNNITIPSEHFSLNVKNNGLDFISIYKDSSIGYESDDSNFMLEGKKLNDSFINMLLKKEIFKNGQFTISINGVDKNNFEGVFSIKNSTAKEFALFNNIIATINTIPSLLFFKDPKFNENGYVIKEGTISFQKIGDLLFFNSIILKGFSADIYGNGYINLNNDDIKLSLRIKTLKDVSKTIEKIPLFSYIILGEDKSIYTDIEVEGKVSKPKIKTNIVKDTLLTPFNIIKRAIESPFKLFQK